MSREESEHTVSGFSLLEPVGKLRAYPRRLRQFLHDVRIEMRQANWPSRPEVWSTTIVVTITVAFFGIFFAITDGLFSRAIAWLINYATH
ncbi:MAG: preprotein translocase subunit SecE [Candidatus Acidiferrales bacterium]